MEEVERFLFKIEDTTSFPKSLAAVIGRNLRVRFLVGLRDHQKGRNHAWYAQQSTDGKRN